MDISIMKIARQSAKFNIISVISLIIQIPTQLIIGKIISPSEFGIVSFVALWSLFAGLLNPNVIGAAFREIPYLIGKKNENEAQIVQNTAVSFDIIWTFATFLVISVASLYMSTRTLKIALFITAVNFLITTISGYWSNFNFARQNFSVVAIGKLIGSIFSPLLIITTVYYLKIYALLLAPVFSALIIIFYYAHRAPINFKFHFEWLRIKDMIKVGFAFCLNGLIFYSQRMADRTIIAAFLPFAELGLYSFAIGFIFFATNFLADFGRVLEPMIWKKSGETEEKRDSFLIIRKIAVYLALITALGIPFLQIAFNIVVPAVTPKYAGSIASFNILSLYIYFAALGILPAVILNSSIVNKQHRLNIAYGIGLAFTVALDYSLLRLKFGISAVSVATVFVQALITFSALIMAKKYVIKENIEFIKLMGAIVLPFLVCIFFTVFNNIDFFRIGTAYRLIASALLQAALWPIIILTFYRKYFAKDKMLAIWSEATHYLRTSLKMNKT